MTHTQQGMQRYLTTSKKDRLKPFLLKKQNNKCLFCKDPFLSTPANDSMKTTFEHLDNDAYNNDSQNLALTHKHCNNDKKHNSDYQLIAQAQLKENHLSADSVDMCVNQTHEAKQTTMEIDLNVAMYKITKQFIDERLLRQNLPAIDFNDTAHCISHFMKEQTGHGSSESAKRHIKDYCCSVAPFKIEEQGGKSVILKRQ